MALFEKDQRVIRKAAVFCAFFSLYVYGYRMMSLAFTHDSLLISQLEDTRFKIGIGRFLEPVYWRLRGPASPFVVCLFLFAFLFGSVVLTLLSLRLTGTLSVFIVSGAVFANAAMINEAATFINYADASALALLLALGGIVSSAQRTRLLPVGALLICSSLCMYQAYVQAASAFALILLISRLLDGESVRSLFLLGVRLLLTLLLGLCLYALVMQIVYRYSGFSQINQYNSVSNIGHYGGSAFLPLLLQAYAAPFLHLAQAPAPALVCQIALALVCAACLTVCLIRGRLGRGAAAALTALLLLLPFSMSFVLFITKGLFHGLMTFAYAFVYVLLAVALERCREKLVPPPHAFVRISGLLAAALSAAIFFQNAAQANARYMERDLQYQSTLSAMTRVLDQAERVPGYVPGQTSVVILGTLSDSAVAMQRPGFESVNTFDFMENAYATTYEYTHIWYFAQSLGYPLRLVDDGTRLSYEQSELTQSLPAYPSPGYCVMIDGKLFIRLS